MGNRIRENKDKEKKDRDIFYDGKGRSEKLTSEPNPEGYEQGAREDLEEEHSRRKQRV